MTAETKAKLRAANKRYWQAKRRAHQGAAGAEPGGGMLGQGGGGKGRGIAAEAGGGAVISRSGLERMLREAQTQLEQQQEVLRYAQLQVEILEGNIGAYQNALARSVQEQAGAGGGGAPKTMTAGGGGVGA